MTLPKYELHCHYGGAIPVEMVWWIINEPSHPKIADSLEDVKRVMTYQDGESYGFTGFLSKFDILNRIHWTPDNIEVATVALVDLLADQSIRYAEIRFSITKYLTTINWTPAEAAAYVGSCLRHMGACKGVDIAPILCIKHESRKDNQAELIKLVNDQYVCEAVEGIDVVGDESFFDVDFLAPIYAEWKRAGKSLIAHVGESQPAKNVEDAILKLNVDRISHGIQAVDHPDIIKLANDRNIAFDIALTSNLKTGVVKDLKNHPIKKMIAQGCQIILGMDDPVILDTSLDGEFKIARDIGLTDEEIIRIQQAAIDNAILK